MSVLGSPRVAAVVARMMQGAVAAAGPAVAQRSRTFFRGIPAKARDITIPTSIAPTRVVVYRPAGTGPAPAGPCQLPCGGYVLRGIRFDDLLCRYLAAEAGVIVVNVDYVVAPQHRFPASVRQAFEVVQWVAGHGSEHGWDGGRLTVGGQSAGDGLTAAVARQALQQGGPPSALQVMHYAALDLSTGVEVSPRRSPSR